MWLQHRRPSCLLNWRRILGIANKTLFVTTSYLKVAGNFASILLKRKRDELVSVYELLKAARLLAHSNDILLKCTPGIIVSFASFAQVAGKYILHYQMEGKW